MLPTEVTKALSRQDAKYAKKESYLFLQTLAPFAPLRESPFFRSLFHPISLARFWIFDASAESILSTAEGLSTGFRFWIIEISNCRSAETYAVTNIGV
jgi:hypothetical protein